ncbi:hypothetical protein B0H14DRAFT_3628667, partial [Mycena olivaceomarginata]
LHNTGPNIDRNRELGVLPLKLLVSGIDPYSSMTLATDLNGSYSRRRSRRPDLVTERSPSESQCQEQRSLPALLSEQKLVPERINSYNSVLTLPTEITIEIFINFLPTYPLGQPLTGPDSPTTLTRICRDWRDIALVTPGLWRAISLSYP